MKPLFVLTFALLSTGASAAENAFAPPAAVSNSLQTLETSLTSEVRALVATPALAPEELEKRVMDALKVAIASGTENTTAPAVVLQTALRLGCAVVTLAPQYAPAITSYLVGLPAIAGIQDARAQIEKAIQDAVAAARPVNPEFGGERGENNVSPSR